MYLRRTLHRPVFRTPSVLMMLCRVKPALIGISFLNVIRFCEEKGAVYAK